MSRILRLLGFSIAVGAAGGIILAALEPSGLTVNSMLSYGAFTAVLTFLAVYAAWRLNPPATVTKLAVAAILLRVLFGVGIALMLPMHGYDEVPQRAGYIFRDAYTRDRQAWEFVEQQKPVSQMFNREELYSDQYGGMLAISAGIYRVFSADAHRPWLIILLSAFASGIGVLFLGRTIEGMFGQKPAAVGSGIYAFYPEAILLGGSQMRDPILMMLIAAAFFFVNRRQEWGTKRTCLWLVPTLIIMVFFSSLVAAFCALVLLIWAWISAAEETRRPLRTIGWLFIVLIIIVGGVLTTAWLRDTLVYEKFNMVQSSGMVQAVTRSLPPSMTVPFLTAYGLFQPVLPAAIFDDSVPIWRFLSSFKAAGWYLFMPLLVYVPLALRKSEPSTRKKQLIVLSLLMLGWILLSSVRGAGDMWDNPRYRTIFLPLLALISAWAVTMWKTHQDGWLGRLYLMAGVFVLIFSAWYSKRKLGFGLDLPFMQVVAIIAAIWLAIILWVVIRSAAKPTTRS